LQQAISHYQMALRIRPEYAMANKNLATALQKLGRPRKAIEHYEEALRIDPDYAAAHNNLAWLRATCANDSIRDGQLALKHAKRAVALAGANKATALDTLSAAFAESGNFRQAVHWQEKAVQIATDKLKPVLAARLERYKRGQPYRESE
jgi:tetratricopeptide (TPR) repeat protein